MKLARVGDPVYCAADLHGAPPFVMAIPVSGIFTSGSPDVFCNNLPTIRLGDPGNHVACPGPNSFTATLGALKTLINDKPAIREGDGTTHCNNPGSLGHVLSGMCSPNTNIE